MPRLHGDHIVCDGCGKEFISANTREQALEEAEKLWSAEEQEEGMGVICDDCFKEIMRLMGRSTES